MRKRNEMKTNKVVVTIYTKRGNEIDTFRGESDKHLRIAKTAATKKLNRFYFESDIDFIDKHDATEHTSIWNVYLK